MPIQKYVNRLKRMDDLIQRKATGTPEQFAQKLNLSNSGLYAYLKELKELGAIICYDSSRQTYCYGKPCAFHFGFKLLNETDMAKQKAGFFLEFSSLQKYWSGCNYVYIEFDLQISNSGLLNNFLTFKF